MINIVCIDFDNPLPPEVSAYLLIESIFLWQSGQNKRNFTNDFCAGQIKTERQEMRFFGFFGIGFEAEIGYETADSTSRTTSITYLIMPSLLETEISFCEEEHEKLFNPYDTIGPTVGSC